MVEGTPDVDRLFPASRLPDEAVVEAAVGHRTVRPVLHRGHQLGRNWAREPENSRIFNRNKMLSFFLSRSGQTRGFQTRQCTNPTINLTITNWAAVVAQRYQNS